MVRHYMPEQALRAPGVSGYYNF